MKRVISIAVIGAMCGSISFANNTNQYYQPTEHMAYASTTYDNPYYQATQNNATYQEPNSTYQQPKALYQAPATLYYEQYPQEYYTGLPQQYPTYNPNYGYNPYHQVGAQQPIHAQYVPQYAQQPAPAPVPEHYNQQPQYAQPQYQQPIQQQQYSQPQYNQQQPVYGNVAPQRGYQQPQAQYRATQPQNRVQQAPTACDMAKRAANAPAKVTKNTVQQPKSQQRRLNNAGTVNQITKFLTDQLSRNRDFKNIAKSKIAVASFVTAENLGKTNKLGRMISENLLHDLQIRGYDVVDYKTSTALSVAKEGAFIFTHDKKKLKKKMAINYIVSGTMEYYNDGVTVNARIIKMKDNKIVSTAQAFIPHHVVAEVLDTLDPYMAFHSKGRALSTIRIVGE
jgi:TolB-like protein